MICSKIHHRYQIEFICVNKECDKRLFCKNCPNLNTSCKIYTKTQTLTLLEKNLQYYTQDINEYQQVLRFLITKYSNQQFADLITNMQKEIQLLQGLIQLLNFLIMQMKNQHYDVNEIDQYFSINNLSGPLNKIKQFCKSLEHLSQIEILYYIYELNTRFKCKEDRKVQIYNYKEQMSQPYQYQNLIMSVMLKKKSDQNFLPSICQLSPDEKIIVILQISEKYVELIAWKNTNPEKIILKFKFSQKIQSFQFSNNSKFIYVWDSKSLSLFKLLGMKKIWRQKFFNRKLITFVRQGNQNKLIICFDKRYIQIYSHNKNLYKVFEMKSQDYSYPLNIILTINKEISSIHLLSLNSLNSSIIKARLGSLKSYRFINQQQQIGVYDQSEFKFKIFGVKLPQITLDIIYSIEFDQYIQNVQFKFEKQFICLISDQEFSIIDLQNKIVQTNSKKFSKRHNYNYIIVPSTKSVIIYHKKFGIEIWRSQQ